LKILITGTAGFIGFHLARKLIEKGEEIIGFDNINDYYDVNLKYARLKETGIDRDEIKDYEIIQSKTHDNYRFIKSDLEDTGQLKKLFKEEKFDIVVNLAAQAGVRYSFENPYAYLKSNINGFLNILESCRDFPVKHLLYASSSSVYGLNKKMPFSVHDNVDHPISLYAASKKSNELMAHTYSYLFNIPSTGLRFFTVYGPWGRPDMAYFLFTKAITEGKPIKVFNKGEMMRDFTYIDDIVTGILNIMYKPAEENNNWNPEAPDPGTSKAPYKIYNIGNSSPENLMEIVRYIEKELGCKAEINLLPLQPGDMEKTYADVEDLKSDFDYKPSTPVEVGVREFVRWYKEWSERGGVG
jgi:UDP-glucuronate 4-epimerase